MEVVIVRQYEVGRGFIKNFYENVDYLMLSFLFIAPQMYPMTECYKRVK